MAGIVNALLAGRSGIQAHGSAIGVLADNISNSNTTGFKASRPDFSDLLASSIGGGGGSIASGNGANLNSVTQVFSQGTFEFTGRGLDLAIDGNGFFIVSDDGARVYSRSGNLNVNADGNLLDQNGNQVLGFPADGSGGLEALNLNQVSQQNVATENVSISGNLDAAEAAGAGSPGGTSFQVLANAANFSTFVDIFDTLGAKHTVTMYFFKTGANAWETEAYVDAGDVGGTPGDAALLDSTTLNFAASGGRSGALPASDLQLTGAWANGADPAATVNVLFDPFTQFSTNSAINSITQDGSGTGSVTAFSVEKDGRLFAVLNNGQTATIGIIALANFANPEGLQRLGNSTFVNTTESGEPIVGTPNSGQFGTVQAGALELSTADIANDFVKLITIQRGFQGSSRMISSVNQLMDEIVNLIR